MVKQMSTKSYRMRVIGHSTRFPGRRIKLLSEHEAAGSFIGRLCEVCAASHSLSIHPRFPCGPIVAEALLSYTQFAKYSLWPRLPGALCRVQGVIHCSQLIWRRGDEQYCE
jgi:hypothetical protein